MMPPTCADTTHMAVTGLGMMRWPLTHSAYAAAVGILAEPPELIVLLVMGARG